MGGHVSERYSPKPIGVNTTDSSYNSTAIGGFLCVTSGNISLTTNAVLQGVPQPVTIFTNFPVVAGVYYPLPFAMQGGYVFTTSGGASGVLGRI